MKIEYFKSETNPSSHLFKFENDGNRYPGDEEYRFHGEIKHIDEILEIMNLVLAFEKEASHSDLICLNGLIEMVI